MGLLINNAQVIGVAMETIHLVKEVLEGDRVLCEEMLWCFGKHPDLEQKPGAESRNYETIHLLHPLPSLFPHLPPLLQGAHATVLVQKFLDSEARLQPITLVAELVYQLNAKQLWSHFHVDTETVEDEANNTLREERGNNGEKGGMEEKGRRERRRKCQR